MAVPNAEKSNTKLLTAAKWQKLVRAIRDGSAHRAFYSLQRITEVFNQRNGQFKKRLEAKEELMVKLHSVDWTIGESGDSENLPSFCISILQHATGKYCHQLKMAEIWRASSSVEWNELTAVLGPQQGEFLHTIAPLLFQNVDNRKSEASDKLVEVLRDYFHLNERRVHVIDDTERASLLLMPNEELSCWLEKATTPTKSGDLLLYLDSDGVYSTIVPRRVLISQEKQMPIWESYANKLIEDLTQFRLLATAFENWLNELIIKGVDWIRLYRKSQEITTQIKGLNSINQLITLLKSELDLSNIYPLRYLAEVLEELSLEEIELCIYDLKMAIYSALLTTTTAYLAEIHEQMAIRASEQEEVRQELERNAERIRQELAEETLRLAKLDGQSLAYGTIRDDPKYEKLKQLYEEQSWANFKSIILTTSPNAKFSHIKTPIDSEMRLPKLYRLLLAAFELDNDQFPGLAERVAQDNPSDITDLETILEQLSVFELTWDDGTGVLECKGKHIRLSQALVQIKNYLNQNYDIREIRIVGSGTVWLDADVNAQDVGHGRNLLIMGQIVRVQNKVTLDTSGSNGRPTASKPATPSGSGTSGADGARGEDGESAGHVHVESAEPMLHGELALLSIHCIGGDGSPGQDGGDGSDGRNGNKGLDGEIGASHPTASGVRLEFKHGQDGEIGQNGGAAGKPGLGGSAGAGGVIRIVSGQECFEKEADEAEIKLTELPNLKTQNGVCGKTGAAGKAGKGGDGGANGLDRAWATESAVWYYPWTPYQGLLESVYYSGWVHRGYTIKKIKDDKGCATKGTAGEKEKANAEAQRQTTTVGARKQSINAKQVRASLKETCTTESHSETNAMQDQIDAVKSTLRNQTAAEMNARTRATESRLQATQESLDGAAAEAKRAREEQEASLEVLQKFKALEEEVTNHLNAEMRQRTQAQLNERETVCIQVDNPTNLQTQRAPASSPTPTPEEVGHEKVWVSYSEKVVCQSANPAQQKEIEALSAVMKSFGRPKLAHAFDGCLQRLLIQFDGAIPTDVLKILGRLIQNERKGELRNIKLEEIFDVKFPNYSAIVYNKSNGEINLEELFSSKSSVKPKRGEPVLHTIFLTLFTKRLKDSELEYFEKALQNALGGYNQVVQSLLLDLLEQQLVLKTKKTIEKGGLMQQALNKVKNAKLTPEQTKSFLGMLRSDLLPVFRNLFSTYAPQFKLSSCLDSAVKHMESEKLLPVVLEDVTKVPWKQLVAQIGREENVLSLHAFLLQHYFTDESELDELETTVKESSHPEFKALVCEIYKKKFQAVLTDQIQRCAAQNEKKTFETDKILASFTQLVESEEAGLSFAVKIQHYRDLADELRKQSPDIKSVLQNLYAKVCAKVLAVIDGGRESAYDGLKAGARGVLLVDAIRKTCSGVKRRTPEELATKLRALAFVLRFEEFTAEILRQLELAFDNLTKAINVKNKLLSESINQVESGLAASWQKQLQVSIDKFETHYDVNVICEAKEEVMTRVNAFIEALTTDNKIADANTVVGCLELRVEILAWLCLDHGKPHRMSSAGHQLKELRSWESAAELITKVVKIIDTEIDSFEDKIYNKLALLEENLNDCDEKIGQKFEEVLSEPTAFKKYEMFIRGLTKSPDISDLLLQSCVVDQLLLLLLTYFSSGALAQFGGSFEKVTATKDLPGGKGAVGGLLKLCRAFTSNPTETELPPPSTPLQLCVQRFCNVAVNALNGNEGEMARLLANEWAGQRGRVARVMGDFRSWTQHRLHELYECGRASSTQARTTISDLRHKYLESLQNQVLVAASMRCIEDLDAAERNAWAEIGRGQLHVTAAGSEGSEQVWLYSLFHNQTLKAVDENEETLHKFTTYTINTLSELKSAYNSQRRTRALLTALQSGFLRLLRDGGREGVESFYLIEAWGSVHLSVATQLIHATTREETSQAETAIWQSLHDNADLFPKESADNLLQCVLRRVYFTPNLSPATRQLILRIHAAISFDTTLTSALETLLGKAEFQQTLAVLHDKKQSSEACTSALHNLVLQNHTTALTLLNAAERRFLEQGQAIGIPRQRLQIPLEEMRDECPSKWSHSVFAPFFVKAALSNLDLTTNPSVEMKLCNSLTLWQASVYKTCEKEPEAEFEDRVVKWTEVVREMVVGCRAVPIPYSQLNTCFVNASRVSSLDAVANVIRHTTSANWMRQLYFLLLDEKWTTLYSNDVEDWKTRLKNHVAAVTPVQHLAQFMEAFLQKLNDSGAAQPDSGAMERIILQIEKQRKIDGMTLEELRDLSLCSWEDGFRVCTYRRKGVEDKATVDLCVRVEKKFTTTTERFVDLVLRREKDFLDSYLTKIRNGEWILSKELVDRLEEETGSIGVRMADEIVKLRVVQGERVVDAFIDLGINYHLCPGKMSREELINTVKRIRNTGKVNSNIYNGTRKNIITWQREEIREWVKAVKNKLTKEAVNVCESYRDELLAVIMRGVLLINSGELNVRDTQLLTVLCFLDSWATRGSNGRFGEIATSEGKTVITGMLAVFLSLGGYSGNVITSSPILATSAANELEPLFQLFGVQVTNICDDACKRGSGDWEQELTKRYKCQIIYSDIGSLQTDLLQNENLGKDYAKNGREPRFMIVDEVDSMLLDKGSHVLYISHTVSELRHLKQIFIDIWLKVKAHKDRSNSMNIILEIRSSVLQRRVPYSAFLRDFILGRLPIWVNYAFDALSMERDDQFIVSTKVTVVDLPTGVEQSSTQYSYGLHQFLQLKYGKKLTAESLKAIFISNMGYFHHYRNNVHEFKLFGLTGTLGCEQSTALLRDTYNVDFFKMPRYQFKRCIKHEGTIAEDEQGFLGAITRSVQSMMKSQPILIICGNVKDAQAVQSQLAAQPFMGGADKRLFAYVSSKQDSDFTSMFNKERPCKAGDVIISTNLAGRGTDLEISSEAKGGLHVILATVPPNERVEKQAFGRTSRKGNNGSTEYITRQLSGMTTHTIEAYQRATNELESTRIRQIRTMQVPQIKLEEELFQKFTTAYQTLMDDTKIWSSSRLCGGTPTAGVQKVYGDLIKNRWAFWLDSVQSQIQAVHLIGGDVVHAKFDEFWEEVCGIAAQQWSLCISAADYVKLARAYEEDGAVEAAISTLLRAIQTEPYYNEIAHYYLGICLLKLDSKGKNFATRWLARHHFKKARLFIERNINNLGAMQSDIMPSFQETPTVPQETEPAVTGKTSGKTKDVDVLLQVQFKNEVDLYERHLAILDDLLGTLIDERFLAGITGIDKDLDEAKEMLRALLEADESAHKTASNRVFKPMRLSRKVRLDADGRLLFGDAALKWSPMLTEYTDGLESCVKAILKRSSSNVPPTPSPKVSACVPPCYAWWDQNYMRHHINDTVLPRPRNTAFIQEEDFEKLAVTKEELWDELLEADFIEEDDYNISYSWIINFDENIFGSLFPSMSEKDKMLIGRFLYDKSFQKYERKAFKAAMKGNFVARWKDVEKRLKKTEILYRQIDFSGTIEENAYNKLEKPAWDDETKLFMLNGLPERLHKFRVLLGHMIIPTDPASKRQNAAAELQRTISTVSVTHLSPYKPEGRALILKQLVSDGVVKLCSVNWGLKDFWDVEHERTIEIENCLTSKVLTDEYIAESKGSVRGTWAEVGSGLISGFLGLVDSVFGSEEHEMCSRVREVFKKRHTIETDAEFKTYLGHLREGVLRSVGSIKTLDMLSVPIEYDKIDKVYSQDDKSAQLPTSNLEEILEFYGADFERVPNVRRKIPWWCSGATYVALLGVLQIVAAATICFMSGGLAVNWYATLFSEGGSDILFAIQSGVSGSFSWKSYALHKTISIVMSLGTNYLAGLFETAGAGRAAMEVGEEMLKFILKKAAWTVGRFMLEGAALYVAGMTVEKILDSIRLKVVKDFRVALTNFFLRKEFKAAMVKLRLVLTNVYEASFKEGMAEKCLSNSFKRLRSASSPFMHALNTVMRTLGHYLVTKICDKMNHYCGRYGWAFSIGQGVLRFFNLSSLLTKGRLSTVFDFALEQVEKLTINFKKEANNLKSRADKSFAPEEKNSEEEWNKAVDDYVAGLENQLVEDSAMNLQREIFEPAVKEYVNRKLSQGFDYMFQNKQLQLNRRVAEAGEEVGGEHSWLRTVL